MSVGEHCNLQVSPKAVISCGGRIKHLCLINISDSYWKRIKHILYLQLNSRGPLLRHTVGILFPRNVAIVFFVAWSHNRRRCRRHNHSRLIYGYNSMDKPSLKGAWSGTREYVINFRFYTPRNIAGMAKATDFKFCGWVGHEKYWPSDDQLSPKWAWSGPRDTFYSFILSEISLEWLKPKSWQPASLI